MRCGAVGKYGRRPCGLRFVPDVPLSGGLLSTAVLHGCLVLHAVIDIGAKAQGMNSRLW
jgi:hypothetical protein